MLRRLTELKRDRRGITGLETAIILIAFVVVASVFAYTILSAGIFSSERGKETIHAGLQEARGTMEPKGGVIAFGPLVLSDCDTVWTAADGNVTVSLETNDKKEGSASVKLTIADAFTTGNIAYYDLETTADLSRESQVRLWLKPSSNINANVLQLVLDDTAGLGSPLETINITALTANTWNLVTVDLANPLNDTAIASVGLKAASDPGAVTLYVDLVETPEQVRMVKFVVANAVNGEPVDLTTTSDSDKDGLLSDETTKNHVTVVSYVDQYQRVEDVAWTKTFLGNHDGDDLLEPGEKAEITVYLNYLYNGTPLTTNTDFVIEVKPPAGSVLNLARTTPARIDPIMDLR